MFRRFVLNRLVWSTVFCNARSVVPLCHLRPNRHSSNQSPPTRTLYSMTSFCPVSVAVSVRPTDAFSNAGCCCRRRTSSAASPLSPSSGRVNSTVSPCRCVFTFYTLCSAARSNCPSSAGSDSFNVLLTSVESATGSVTSVDDVAPLSCIVEIGEGKNPANLFTEDLPSSVTCQFACSPIRSTSRLFSQQ